MAKPSFPDRLKAQDALYEELYLPLETLGVAVVFDCRADDDFLRVSLLGREHAVGAAREAIRSQVEKSRYEEALSQSTQVRIYDLGTINNA